MFLFFQTVLVDENRLVVLQEEIEKLTVVCGVLLVTYSTVGAPIAGVQSLKATLKDHLLTILRDIPVRSVAFQSLVSVSLRVRPEISAQANTSSLQNCDWERTLQT